MLVIDNGDEGGEAQPELLEEQVLVGEVDAKLPLERGNFGLDLLEDCDVVELIVGGQNAGELVVFAGVSTKGPTLGGRS